MRTLIIVDVQRDFMPGGALGIAEGDQIVPLINTFIPKFDHIIATMDWHPLHHVSFSLWPVHCVQNTWGAALSEKLHRERIEKIFHKGADPNVDSYSAFFDEKRNHSTGLAHYLRDQKLQDLYFVGLATDYCVLYSVLDAIELGFCVTVIRDACRAIHNEEGALSQMQERGARIAFSQEFL